MTKSFEEKQARVRTFNRIVRCHIDRGIVDIAKLEAVCRKGFTPISPFELHLTLRRLERLGEITRCKFFGDTITIVWLDALDKACTQEEE